MHILIAIIILGVAVSFVLPWLKNLVSPVLPASVAGNTIVQVLIVGALLLAVLYAAHEVGLGKYLRKA